MREQHRLLCEHHIRLNFSNASKAARLAGYKDSPTIYAKASQILARPECQEYINTRIKEILSETDKMTLEWLTNVRRIMNADMRKVLKWGPGQFAEFIDSGEISDDDAYAISEVSETVTKTGATRKIKLESKGKALELMGKFLDILDGDQSKGDDDSQEKLSRDERKQLIAALTKKQ